MQVGVNGCRRVDPLAGLKLVDPVRVEGEHLVAVLGDDDETITNGIDRQLADDEASLFVDPHSPPGGARERSLGVFQPQLGKKQDRQGITARAAVMRRQRPVMDDCQPLRRLAHGEPF